MTEAETLTSGMVGKQMKLEFSDEWEGLSKTAVFSAGAVTRDVVGVTDLVTIPAEVLAEPLKQLYVGIYGTSADDTLAIPTLRAAGPWILPGADPSGDESTDATLPVWSQLQEQIDAILADGPQDGLSIYYTSNTLSTSQLSMTTGQISSLETYGRTLQVGDLLISSNGVLGRITAVNDTKYTAKGIVALGGGSGDAVSPVVSVSKSGKTTTITITDVEGTKTATIYDGEDGNIADLADGSILPEKTSFIAVTGSDGATELVPDFTNLADPSSSEWTVDHRYNSSNAIVEHAGIDISNCIPCVIGDVIRIQGMDGDTASVNNYFQIAPYDQNGTLLCTPLKCAKTFAQSSQVGILSLMDAAELETGVYCYTLGQRLSDATTVFTDTTTLGSTAYIRVSGAPLTEAGDIIVTINEPITYTETTTSRAYTLDEKINVPQAVENSGRLDKVEADLAGGVTDSVEILLPSEAVAVEGMEFNIYHCNIIHGSRPLDYYDVRWDIDDTGVTMERFSECLRITPTADHLGDHTLTVQLKDRGTGTVCAEKAMTLHIIANAALSGKYVLYMGDSLTYSRGGLYAAEIQYNLSGGGLISIGSQDGSEALNTIGVVKHEGYNGAAIGGFLAENVTSASVNPFYNPDTGAFDLAYFMTAQGYTQLDAVCLNLGHNNIGNHVNGVADLRTLIEKIHAYHADLPILISLITPLAGQDAWRDNTYTAAQMRTHWRNLIAAYLEAFDGEAVSNVYLSAPYLAIDPDFDFPTETVARSSRDETQITRQSDGMHPNRIGTLKMADVYYANLLYRLA